MNQYHSPCDHLLLSWLLLVSVLSEGHLQTLSPNQPTSNNTHPATYTPKHPPNFVVFPVFLPFMRTQMTKVGHKRPLLWLNRHQLAGSGVLHKASSVINSAVKPCCHIQQSKVEGLSGWWLATVLVLLCTVCRYRWVEQLLASHTQTYTYILSS